MLSPTVIGQRRGLSGMQSTRIGADKVIGWQRRYSSIGGLSSAMACEVCAVDYRVSRIGFDLFRRQRSEQYLT